MGFVPGCMIDNGLALIRIMAWCRTGDKPLFELMMLCFTGAYQSIVFKSSYHTIPPVQVKQS